MKPFSSSVYARIVGIGEEWVTLKYMDADRQEVTVQLPKKKFRGIELEIGMSVNIEIEGRVARIKPAQKLSEVLSVGTRVWFTPKEEPSIRVACEVLHGDRVPRFGPPVMATVLDVMVVRRAETGPQKRLIYTRGVVLSGVPRSALTLRERGEEE